MAARPPDPTTAERLEAVKAACDAAPDGARKDTALRHYRAAAKAQAARHEGECNRRLDAAAHALGPHAPA